MRRRSSPALSYLARSDIDLAADARPGRERRRGARADVAEAQAKPRRPAQAGPPRRRRRHRPIARCRGGVRARGARAGAGQDHAAGAGRRRRSRDRPRIARPVPSAAPARDSETINGCRRRRPAPRSVVCPPAARAPRARTPPPETWHRRIGALLLVGPACAAAWLASASATSARALADVVLGLSSVCCEAMSTARQVACGRAAPPHIPAAISPWRSRPLNAGSPPRARRHRRGAVRGRGGQGGARLRHPTRQLERGQLGHDVAGHGRGRFRTVMAASWAADLRARCGTSVVRTTPTRARLAGRDRDTPPMLPRPSRRRAR